MEGEGLEQVSEVVEELLQLLVIYLQWRDEREEG